ncbi:MAG: hypothetical protein PHS92_03630 [Candidatus Gracilibacteria bacterium]|nr:hypothetical protein [Candidatus Gracilibacteria bacterium]
MIQSYKEEIKSKKRKNMIFWAVVLTLACYLYLFFQGYYLNVDFNLKTQKTTDIFKQFGIINVQVFPDSDSIKINGIEHGNVSKSIFNLGKYEVLIEREGYIPVSLNLYLNKDNLFYTNTINLIKKPLYFEIASPFDSMSNIGDYYLAVDKSEKSIRLFDKKLILIKTLPLGDYNYIGKNYFTIEDQMYIYDFDLNIIKPLLTKDSIPKNIFCKNLRLINDDFFCYDTMTFLTSQRNFGKYETILRINNNIILTENSIYNNMKDSNWSYYKHEDKNFTEPEAIVLYDGLPYYLKDGSLYSLQTKKQEKLYVPEITSIIKAQNFQDDMFLVGYDKDKRIIFVLSDGKRRYTGYLDNTDINNLEITKNNGIYFFKTKNSLEMYYKGGKNIIKIIEGEILGIFDNKAFFKMNGKNYYMQILED